MSFLVSMSESQACSPVAVAPLLFDHGSADVSARSKELVLSSLTFAQSVEPRCVFFKIEVTSDGAETDSTRDVLGAKRAATAKRLLVDAGFLASNITTHHGVSGAAMPSDVYGIRRADFNWHWAKGNLRCDP